MAFWLLKSEPSEFSWNDLLQKPNRQEIWDGVRNYQARNYIRSMRPGDLALFYHSSIPEPAIMGIVRIISDPFPDPSQFDPRSPYYDPRSSRENPRWYSVFVQAIQTFYPPIERSELKKDHRLQTMELFRKGSRLSVMPVLAEHWQILTKYPYKLEELP